jgi:L-asparaginase
LATDHRTDRPTPGRSTLVLLAAAVALATATGVGAQDTAQAVEALPRVTVIGTGGTIAGTSTTRTSFQSYRAGQLLIADMVDDLRPEIDEVAEVTAIQFDNRPSGGYGVEDYFELSLAIDQALETADVVVVTTGTDTMEEFVYWMDLTVRSPKPVVFTGAMRPWTVVGSDGHPNLFNAIVLAASGATTCFGTVLMLNDEFHAAKDVWKSDGARMDTFISRRFGALGSVDGLQVRAHRAPPRVQHCDTPERWRTPFDLGGITADDLPRTEVLIGYQGARLDEAVLAFADAGVRGIVNAAGGISAEAREAAEEKGVVFARTQRLRSGGHNLLPQKARLLLLLSLAFAEDTEQAQAWFDEIGAMEFEAWEAPVPGG